MIIINIIMILIAYHSDEHIPIVIDPCYKICRMLSCVVKLVLNFNIHFF